MKTIIFEMMLCANTFRRDFDLDKLTEGAFPLVVQVAIVVHLLSTFCCNFIVILALDPLRIKIFPEQVAVPPEILNAAETSDVSV